MARIVVADDEEGVRTFLAEALELEGHDVASAADGIEALALLRASGADVLVTDLKMPAMDGLELLRAVRAEMPETEVIVLTAHGNVESAVSAMRAGAFDFVQKPIGSPAELRLLVARALERRALLDARESSRRSAPALELTWGAPAMRSVVAALEKVAPTDATVLLTGESGTGKEVAARFLHARSRRAQGPFAAINCAALSPSLLESELFGAEKGAFTGAHARRRGRLELAAGGTFFLDEVGELAPELQAKLLRVLQERSFERVGGGPTLRADVRWIAATNRDLGAMMREGRFREDLYHRLAVFPLRMPPLRERPEDVVPLARRLLEVIAAELGRARLALEADAEAWLASAPWAGNVRELRNTLERAAILAEGDRISRAQLVLDPALASAAPASSSERALDLDALEKDAIERALAVAAGNRKRAAELLGIGERTLYDKLKRHGLK